MAKVFEFTPERQADWDAWLADKPDCIRELATKYPPNLLYRMASTGHRVTLVAYDEGGTLRVAITGKYNLVTFERQVFGIDPNDLTECDLPGPDDLVGAPPEEIQEAVIQGIVSSPGMKHKRLVNNPSDN